MDEIEQMRKDLLGFTDAELEVERVVQLTRIADALVAIEESGVYVYQQGTEEEAEPRSGRRQG